MSIIKSRYKELGPDIDFLTDIAVLAQAWKKTHPYIRRHNWYANVLDLDISAFNLESRLKEWASDLASDRFSPKPLRLVPAPKNWEWVFSELNEADDFFGKEFGELGNNPGFNDWTPATRDGKEIQPLRPLAHIQIRDQVLATTAMLCVANPVETAQGDPSLDALEAHELGVVSYGNRLHSMWRQQGGLHIADFSWGNSRSYSDYFEHYQSFLARPEKVCSALYDSLPQSRELFVVNLDLKAFFTNIDLDALIKRLQNIVTDHQPKIGSKKHTVKSATDNQEKFWDALKKITDWSWHTDDHETVHKLFEENHETFFGLPQGLMASGFLANAYLLEFDRDMVEVYTDDQRNEKFQVHDYCRYVDDIRLVVSAPVGSNGNNRLSTLLDQCHEIVSDILLEHSPTKVKRLEINLEKSEIQPFHSMTRYGRVSSLMKSLGGHISGPLDVETLLEVAGGLEGLLSLSEQLSSKVPQPSRLSLANIAKPMSDVRDDTVKRFVSSRLARVLRERLTMADGPKANNDVDRTTQGHAESNRALAHEFESTARKLIKIWADNPSLVLLLRCGLDLFPCPSLLSPVLEALEVKIDERLGIEEIEYRDITQKLTAFYCLAELLRAAATETGYRDELLYPDEIDISGYRHLLAGVARKVLDKGDTPWYVKQQSLLFFASVQNFSWVKAPSKHPMELRPYIHLLAVMRYRVLPSRFLSHLPLALVAQQINPDKEGFSFWFLDHLHKAKGSIKEEAVKTLALNAPHLLLSCLDNKDPRKKLWKRFIPPDLIAYHRINGRRHQAELPNELTLLTALASTHNPFDNENGVLALAKALLESMVELVDQYGAPESQTEELSLLERASPGNIILICGNWNAITSLSEGLTAKLIASEPQEEWELYRIPEWIEEDKSWLYGLGRLLRAAITGELDFTARQLCIREDFSNYTGLRSTWFQRRSGLTNHSRGLLQEPAPLTPWLSSFLTALLQWPGISLEHSVAREVGSVDAPQDLLNIVNGRIKKQKGLYGERSKTPIQVIPTKDCNPVERPLRVVMAQTLYPKIENFDKKDPLHWTPAEMAIHRRHLAKVCKLIQAQVIAWDSVRKKATEKSDEDSGLVDLVVFPELSVHPNHIEILRTLSDSLGATIFAGLTYLESPKTGEVVNQGLWLIRTEQAGGQRNHEYVWQGKKYPMKLETPMGVKSYRPHITLVEFPVGKGSPTRIAAAICYDSTDLDLMADLRDKSDVFIVASMNKDVQTFDNMVNAVHFHMYQPVILVNSGEFGGSTAQAPYSGHDKLISHLHGGNQVAVSIFEIEPWHFKSPKPSDNVKSIKTAPAGFNPRNR